LLVSADGSGCIFLWDYLRGELLRKLSLADLPFPRVALPPTAAPEPAQPPNPAAKKIGRKPSGSASGYVAGEDSAIAELLDTPAGQWPASLRAVMHEPTVTQLVANRAGSMVVAAMHPVSGLLSFDVMLSSPSADRSELPCLSNPRFTPLPATPCAISVDSEDRLWVLAGEQLCAFNISGTTVGPHTMTPASIHPTLLAHFCKFVSPQAATPSAHSLSIVALHKLHQHHFIDKRAKRESLRASRAASSSSAADSAPSGAVLKRKTQSSSTPHSNGVDSSLKNAT